MSVSRAAHGSLRARFEQAYAAGILDEEPEPPRRFRAGVAAAEPYALRGCVLTPARVFDDAYVVVNGDRIAAVQEQPPEAVRIVETAGVILPGLIDLHGHPEFNVFAAWEPPRRYANRYQWRRSKEYAGVVRTPWGRLQADPPLPGTLTRYAEVRALVGGVTAIQGASRNYPDKEEALVRNVDLRIFGFGPHRARSIIDLGRTDAAERTRLRAQIDSGAVRAVYVHLAEGVDDPSRAEFDTLVGAGLLTAATVIIHGTALTGEQLGQVKDAGAKLVWSPQSNLRLYGQTTRAADALTMGIPMGLGADWLPSGSSSLLAELKVARRVLALQGAAASARQLVGMVTWDAAQVAALADFLGSVEAGRPADLLVLERRRDDPWENVVDADPAWVELVTIGGNLAYGRPDWIGALGDTAGAEPVLAWGKPMLLDTTYSVRATASPAPRLAELRQALIARFPQVGPIFA